jgi:hypothetical protein
VRDGMDPIIKQVVKNVAAKKSGNTPDIKSEAEKAAFSKLMRAAKEDNVEIFREAWKELKAFD